MTGGWSSLSTATSNPFGSRRGREVTANTCFRTAAISEAAVPSSCIIYPLWGRGGWESSSFPWLLIHKHFPQTLSRCFCTEANKLLLSFFSSFSPLFFFLSVNCTRALCFKSTSIYKYLLINAVILIQHIMPGLSVSCTNITVRTNDLENISCFNVIPRLTDNGKKTFTALVLEIRHPRV